MDQILLDLRETQDYLRVHGLHKNGFVPQCERMWYGQSACIAGAMRIVIIPGIASLYEGNESERERIIGCTDAIESGTDTYSIVSFNDDETTTLDDVIALLDRAIQARVEALEV